MAHRWLPIAAILWGLAPRASLVAGGTVVGAVHVSATRTERNLPVRGLYRGGATPAARADQAQAIVYLTGVRSPEPWPPPPPQVINQVNRTFVPNLLPVLVGTEVTFPNNDRVYHNAFSYSKPKRFDLGRYAKGKTRSVIFDNPGIVRVFCEIHTNMRAVIVVLENPFFTVVTSGRPYRLSDVPPGDYTIHVWHKYQDPQDRPLSIEEGDTITVDFSL